MVVSLLFAGVGAKADVPQGSFDVGSFIENYCIECHLQDDPSGEREFETLDFAGSDLNTQITLQEIVDQLTLSTMPPAEADQPTTGQRLSAIRSLTATLQAMRAKTVSTGGHTVLRRLSNREYRNTVGDLLGIDMTMFDPTISFPKDNLRHNHDNVGDALITSGHLLQRYLDAADICIEKAFSVSEKPEVRQWRFAGDFKPQTELKAAHATFDNRYMALYDHPFNDKTEGAYGHISGFREGVHVSGIYEVQVLAEAKHRDTPYRWKAVKIDLEEPFRLGIRPGDTLIEDMVHQQPIQPKLAESVIKDGKPAWYTFQVPLDAGFVPRFTFENGIHDVRGSFGRVFKHHRETLPKSVRQTAGIFRQRIAVIQHGQMPQIRIHEIKIRGPIDHPWPTLPRQRYLGGTDFAPENVRGSLRSFASTAYRRPATETELNGLVNVYQTRQHQGRSPFDAYKDSLKAALCSPAFLYFKHEQTPPGQAISEHALAERLSYFLTSSMPDQGLRSLADQGRLSDPDVLKRETKRLLASERSSAFVTDFLDSWLNLRSLGSMPPDPKAFWFFYASDLKSEMKRETQLFFRDLVLRNQSALRLIDAKHSFINRDLAKLYDVEDRVSAEDASEFKRFEFDDPKRGGLLGQASVMTVSANGIETSPVVRGVLLLENILGTPPPPPPDEVPAIDPDVRGAKNIRDLLSKHSESEACLQCHRKIDPLGFALECFDPVGQFRNSYDKKGRQQIDTSGVLPGGEAFHDVASLKQLLLQREEFFVRTLTKRLLTHALGRAIEPTDRDQVDAIVREARGHDADNPYPLATLIETIVQSKLFVSR